MAAIQVNPYGRFTRVMLCRARKPFSYIIHGKFTAMPGKRRESSPQKQLFTANSRLCRENAVNLNPSYIPRVFALHSGKDLQPAIHPISRRPIQRP